MADPARPRPWRQPPRPSPRARKIGAKQLWSSRPAKWRRQQGRLAGRQSRAAGGWNADSKPPPRHSEIGGHHEEYIRPASRGKYRQAPFGHVHPGEKTKKLKDTSRGGSWGGSRPSSRASQRDAAQVSALPDNPMDKKEAPSSAPSSDKAPPSISPSVSPPSTASAPASSSPPPSALSPAAAAQQPERSTPSSNTGPESLASLRRQHASATAPPHRPGPPAGHHGRGRRKDNPDKSTCELGQSVIQRRPQSPFQPYKNRSSEERQKLALVKLRSLYDGRSKFHKIYEHWDVNRDGGIDVAEFQVQLHHHGFDWLTDEDVDGLFHRFIPEDKHRLDYKAFRQFLFQHAIEDTTWDAEYNPFQTGEYAGYKSPRLKKEKQRRKVTDPNPFRRLSGRLDEDPSAERGSPRSSALPPPSSRPPTRLEYDPPARLPESLERLLGEHGNKIMREMKRLNGGRHPVDRKLCADVFANVRARQNLPFNESQLNALCGYLAVGKVRSNSSSSSSSSNNNNNNNDDGGGGVSSRLSSAGRSQPFHHVIGRIRQAQRNAQMRHRWKKNQDFQRRAVDRFSGFCRPGTAHVHYGTQGNASLMEVRQMFIDRMTDGTPSPRSSRPSTAASRLTGGGGGDPIRGAVSSSTSRPGSRQQRRGTQKTWTWGRL